MSAPVTIPIEFVRAGVDAYGKHDGHWWLLDEHGNPGLRVRSLVNPVASLVDALDALQVAEAETARIVGIARMRGRHLAKLTSYLRLIADAGCSRVRAGLAACVVSDDENRSAPCHACVARLALDAQPAGLL